MKERQFPFLLIEDNKRIQTTYKIIMKKIIKDQYLLEIIQTENQLSLLLKIMVKMIKRNRL
jgi:hypothetical protein